MTQEEIIRMAWEQFHEHLAGPFYKAPPQQVQEPVAKYSDIVSDGKLDPRNKFDAPQQRPWVGLTDEDVNALQALVEELEAQLKHTAPPPCPTCEALARMDDKEKEA
jgi:hypothetical protein